MEQHVVEATQVWRVPRAGVPCALARPHWHRDGQVRESLQIAIDGEHESGCDDTSIYAREAELVLSVENLSGFGVNNLAGSQQLQVKFVSGAVADDYAHMKIAVEVTSLWPELGRLRVSE